MFGAGVLVVVNPRQPPLPKFSNTMAREEAVLMLHAAIAGPCLRAARPRAPDMSAVLPTAGLQSAGPAAMWIADGMLDESRAQASVD